MARVRELVGFASQVYGVRTRMAWQGLVRRDPVALLQLGPGRTDPYPVYDRIRRTAPLVPTPLGNVASADHDVCALVLRDRRFGVRPEEPVPDTGGLGLSFLELDPPDHTRLRRLAAPAFTAARVASYQPKVQATVQRLVDAALQAGSGGFDLVSALATPLPVAVITDLLGIPESERGPLVRHGEVLASGLDGVRSLRHARTLLATSRELEAMFARVFTARRSGREGARDEGSLIDTFLDSAGDRVAPEELVPLCTLLLVAGFETTVNLVGNAVHALVHHPDQWALLRDDPGRTPAAVEETLRFDAPVQRTARVAHRDVELDGTVVTRGQVVLTLLGGANRDPAVFPDPGVFDLTRPNAGDHLAFSSGVHYCLGAPLARLEAVVALEHLVERMPRLRLAGRPTRGPGRTLRGFASLPVTT